MKTSQPQATKEPDQKTHTYYQMRDDVADKAVSLKLSATAYRLWIHLCRLFPFGDRTVEMPTHADLALTLGVSVRSVFRAAAELSEADLWTFQVERWKGRNLTGHKSPGQAISQNAKDVTPTAKDVTDAAKDVTSADKFVSQNAKDVTPTPSEPLPVAASTTPHTLQTLKTNQTLSEDPIKSERENLESSPNLPIQDEQEEELISWIGRQNKNAKNPRAYALKCLEIDRHYWEEAYRQFLKSKNRTNVPAAALPVENNFPKAFVDMNPSEQADYKAEILRMRQRVEGGDPAFTNLANTIANISLGTHP
jgi:hypothetical protein